ncbi:MAG TPA: choice-of-anchor R domain-containing protein, partial [Thermoplasmata archaeon]|nr:choice-of-anchor R domain-containing protein [Thermoplasmata archaeon]
MDASGILAYSIETNLRTAQSFVPAANFTASRVGLFVQDTGRDDSLTVQIASDLAGLPDTGNILASSSNNTDASFAWANFTLAPGLTLVRGTRYWILAEDNAGNGEGYLWRYVSADVYPRGAAATASGGSWTVQAGDFSFIVYGWTPSDVAMAVSVDRATVAGGDALRLTIDFANGGTEDASNAWVNVTLDPRLRFVSGGPGPVSAIGPAVSFRPPSIPNGTSSLVLNVTGDAVLQDNVTITLPVSAEFFDGVASRYLATSATVQTVAPQVTASLALARSVVDPGSLVAYVVTVTNRGNATARHVWVNETLHPALTYLSDTAPVAADQSGARQSWHFLDVGPGTSRFNVTVQVDPGVPANTVIANFLSVEFTDPVGAGLVRGKSNTVWLDVAGLASGSGNPWLWGSFAISATVVGGTYLGYARRRLRTEEIFLIHHSGVLLVHMSKSIKADHDSDIVSGMLTAILNFVRDAFHYDERQELQGLDLGQYRVHVRKGG